MRDRFALRAAGVVLGALVYASTALAQTSYQLDYTMGTYQPITGGQLHPPNSYAFGYDAWDEGAARVDLPFTFSWYGNPYTAIWVYTNGFASFDAPPTMGNVGILRPPGTVPDTQNQMHNFIAPMWTDLTGISSGGQITGRIRSRVEGNAPARTVVVQFSGFKRAQNPQSNASFQIRLFEGTGTASVIWGPNDSLSGGTSAIENDTGQEGENILRMPTACGLPCVCVPRGCGSLNWAEGLTVQMELPNTAELVGSIVGPRGAYPGDDFAVYTSLRNVGRVAAGPFEAQIRLSADTTIDSNDMLLATVDVSAGLPALTSSTATVTVTMPPMISVDRFFLGLIVDAQSTVAETIENNNTAYDAGGIVSGPDLALSIDAPLSSGPGEFISVNVELRSVGAPVAAPVDVAFYLSTDAIHDAGDLLMGATSLVMPDGFSLDETVDVQIPQAATPSPPTYRVLAIVDASGSIDETDESNNAAAAPGALTLSAPDLTAAGLTAEPFAFRGLTYPVTAQVANLGGTSGRRFTVCVLISENQLISVLSDPVLVRTGTITLAAGESANLLLQPVIPIGTATGAWYLALAVDCESTVTENLETNNVLRLEDQIQIRDPAPDFTPIEIATSSAAAAGEAIAVSAVIANYGNVNDAVHVRFVLSENPGPTLMDPMLWQTTSPVAIDASRERTVAAWVSLPSDIPSGEYYIGAIVDPDDDGDEVIEANNVIGTDALVVAGADLAVISPDPPNAVTGVSYVWRFVAVGGAGSYTWSIAWATGSPPAGLSFDGALGELAGQPADGAQGSHDFTVTASSQGATATRAYRLLVIPPTLPLTIVSAKLPPALQAEPYNVKLVAVGGTPPYEWALDDTSALPAGMRLDIEGNVGGEAQGVGAYTFIVHATDTMGATADTLVAIDVIDPAAGVTITTADIPSGVVGDVYDVTFTAAGGQPPFLWRFEGDRIPGVRYEAGVTASLVGTPTVAGSYAMIVEVRDSQGLLDRNAYILEIFELGDLVITTAQGGDDTLPAATVGQPYLAEGDLPVQLNASRRMGTSAIRGLTWSVVLGTTPPGLNLGADGVIAGTPIATGVYAFTVMAHDASGDVDRATLAIVVSEPGQIPGPGGDESCSCASTPVAGGPSWSLLLFAGLIALMFYRRRPRLRRSPVPVGVAGLLALGLASPAMAQSVPYQVVTSPMTYVPLANGIALSPPLGDGNVAEIALPFDFYLYGTPHNRIWVNANGFLAVSSVSTGHHFAPRTNPSAAAPNGFIAPMWSDWCSSFGGPCGNPQPSTPEIGVYYQIDPTPGAGSITVEWRAVRHYSDVGAPTAASFQAVLHEGQSGQIELMYGDLLTGIDFSGNPVRISARIGIESADGSEGMWVGPCSGASACTTAQVEAMANRRVQILVDAGDDVTLTGVSVPAVGYPGLPLPVSARYVSRHGDSLGPTEVAAVLVPRSATSTAAGLRLWTSGAITLAPYESRSLNVALEIPADLQPGHYRLAMVADHLHQLAETDETNNVVWSAHSIRIAGRAPDFRVRALRVGTETAAPGDSIDVSYAVENAGNEPGDLSFGLYLSSNAAISDGDIALGSPITAATLSRQVVTGTMAVQLPADLPTGSYYLGIIADAEGLVAELDETNNTGRAPTALDVHSSEVVIVTDSLPPAVLTRHYSGRIQAIGGDGAFTFRLVDGTVPRGLLFNAALGAITGIPLETGRFPLEFEARSGRITARKTVGLEIIDPQVPLTILSDTLPHALAHSDYAVTIRTIGGVEPLRWRVLGRLPEGLVVATDGTILGVPRRVGRSTFGIEVRDNASSTATVALELETRAPSNLSIISSALPGGELGEGYRYELEAAGGVPPYKWTAITATPPGLVISSEGVVGGVPEAIGKYRVQIQIADAVASVDTNVLTVEVTTGDRFFISTVSLAQVEPGEGYKEVVRVEGGSAPYRWSIVEGGDALPPGISTRSGMAGIGETDDDFVIEGAFEAPGVWAVTVRVQDAHNQMSEKPFALVAMAPPPPPPMVITDEGCTCVGQRRGPLGVLSLVLVLPLFVRRRF